jgi:excisionase family DNA binding protein
MGERRPASQDLDDHRLLLSVEDAAARLSIGRTTLFALIREGRIRTVRIKRRTLMSPTALDEFVADLETGSRMGTVGFRGVESELTLTPAGYDGK